MQQVRRCREPRDRVLGANPEKRGAIALCDGREESYARNVGEIIARLHKEATAILRAPEVRERLVMDGNEVVAGSPEEFVALIKAEIVKWAKVVKAAGIQLE